METNGNSSLLGDGGGNITVTMEPEVETVFTLATSYLMYKIGNSLFCNPLHNITVYSNYWCILKRSRFLQITQISHFCTKLTWRGLKRFQKKIASSENWTCNWPSLVYKSDAYLTVPTRHVLIRKFFKLNFVSCTTSFWTSIISRF